MSETKCPVCSEEVEVARHTPKKLVKGVIYHFCSDDCRVEFKKDPDQYVNSGPNIGAYT